MDNQITLVQWVENFNKGVYSLPDTKTQCEAGWFDWFCDNKSLRNKTYKMAPMVKRIAKSPLINPTKTYVFFKNNCPCNGSLYDDFRICDIENGDVLFTITPKEGYANSKPGEKATVWGRQNDFKEPLIRGTIKDIYKFFQV